MSIQVIQFGECFKALGNVITPIQSHRVIHCNSANHLLSL